MNQDKRNQIYREIRDIFKKYDLSVQDKHIIISDLVLGHHVRIDLEHIREEVRAVHDKNIKDMK